MYGCESWTVKKAECQRIDAFELWCWRRLLRVPWTARRSNQSILKEISPGCSLEGMMLKLKLQYFGHLMRRVDSLEKTLILGEIGGRRRRGWQRMRWLDGITYLMHVSLNELRELVIDREAWHALIHGVTKSWTQLSDWTELILSPSLQHAGNQLPLQTACPSLSVRTGSDPSPRVMILSSPGLACQSSIKVHLEWVSQNLSRSWLKAIPSSSWSWMSLHLLRSSC